MKKVISVLLSVLMLCGMTTGLDLTAYAADTTITGKCGENATYLYNKNTKTLTISGTGVINNIGCDYPSDSSIASLIIEDGITGIGGNMFSECENLENIVIPDSVVSIYRDAFKGTKYYNDDSNWQDGRLYINHAFICVKADSAKGEFKIKEGTTVIADGAFNDDEVNITSVYIPESVKGIPEGIFRLFCYLKSIDVNQNNKYYTSDNGVLFNKTKTVLITYPQGAENESYSIPKGVKRIGEYAFSGCSHLSNIIISDEVTSIGYGAFYSCEISSITIPDSVTHIGELAFSGCHNLNNIDMSSNIESVGTGAFGGTAYYDNKSNWDNGVLYVGAALIAINADSTGTYQVKDSTRVIAGDVFRACRLTEVLLPNGLVNIGARAFAYCKNLESINMPDSVTKIGECAFYQCTALEKVAFSESLTTIGEMAFGECSKISSISLPDSVKVIERSAFLGCTGFSTIYIPGDHVRVGYGAFSYQSVIFCNSTTQIDDYPVFYVDKAISVKNFKDLYSSDYDDEWDHNCWEYATLYSFVANESGTYYAGGNRENADCMYIFDENFNFVKSKKIDKITNGAGNPSGGLSLYLEKGHKYYFLYGGLPKLEFKLIKDYQYIDSGKQYIQGEFSYYETPNLKIVYPDDSFLMDTYDTHNIDSKNLAQPITLQYYGKTLTFSLNNLVAINSLELLNKEYIDDGFIAALKSYDHKTVKKYPLVFRLHLSNGKSYDIENYSMSLGYGYDEPPDYDCVRYYEYSMADGRQFGIEFIYNDSRPNELKVKINNCCEEPDPSVVINVNSQHKHNFVLTVTNSATCTDAGSKTYTCSICGQEECRVEKPIGHAYMAQVIAQATCTAYGRTKYTCTRCGDSYTVSNINPKGHQYKSQLTKATTAKDGQSYKKCSVCGAVTGKSVIAKASNIKLNKTAYTYNGKVQRPSVIVKDSKGKALKNGTDYKISYPKGMKNVGKYTVKVTLKGNYSGSKSMTYNINPKGTGVSKVKAAKKGFKVTWKKQATQTTGYQVQYSTSSKFKKAKTVTISKNKTTSKSVSKLSAKKKYYVRVRTYKTVKVNGKNVKLYSGWSKAKSVTTKK